MSIADDLRSELNVLIELVNMLRIREGATRRYFLATGSPSDLGDYMEAAIQLNCAFAKIELINQVLRDNPGE